MSYNKQKQARKQQQGKTHCKQQGLVLTVWCSAVRKSMMWRESSILIKMISRESPEVSAFSRLHRSPCWKLTFLLQLFLVVDGTKLWSFHWLATITGIFQSPLVSRASIFWCVCLFLVFFIIIIIYFGWPFKVAQHSLFEGGFGRHDWHRCCLLIIMFFLVAVPNWSTQLEEALLYSPQWDI